MLSIGKLGKGQERYYLDKVAEGAEDYYSARARPPRTWTPPDGRWSRRRRVHGRSCRA